MTQTKMPEELTANEGLTLNSEEAERLNALLDADEAADAAQGKQATPNEPEPGLEDKAAQPPPKPEDANEAGKPADKPGTQDAAKPEDKKPETEPQPPKSRFQKEQDRQAKTWQKINEEKETLKKEREQIEAEKARWQAEQAEQKRQQQPTFTAEDYEKAAERWESEGKYDLAEQARAAAEEMKKQPSAEAQARQRQAHDAFLRAQGAAWAKAKAEVPEIMDKSSPANAKLVEFLNQHPQVMRDTEGPYLATLFVRDSIAASRVPELLKQVEQLQGKVKELEALTSFPGGGVAQTPRGEPDFASLSTSDMEKAIEEDLALLQR